MLLVFGSLFELHAVTSRQGRSIARSVLLDDRIVLEFDVMFQSQMSRLRTDVAEGTMMVCD
jgi:hypothetical protein